MDTFIRHAIPALKQERCAIDNCSALNGVGDAKSVLERLACWERIFGNDRHMRCDLKLERAEMFPEDKVTAEIYIKSFA